MSVAQSAGSVASYRAWQRDSVRIGDRNLYLATKPGLFAHGVRDEASLLLAEHVAVHAGDAVAYLNCGSGLVGALAAATAHEVVLSDRNAVSYEAAQRTVALNTLGNTRVLLAQGLPDTDADSLDVVCIRLPHDRLSQLQLLRDAGRVLRAGGMCYIAAAVNEGIKPATRAMERLFGNAIVLATRGGHRVVRASKPSGLPDTPDEFTNPLLAHDAFHLVRGMMRGNEFSIATRPGVFSWEHPDEATVMLAESMQIPPGSRVLDLGCGAGPLGTIAALDGAASVCMVDADSEAVRCASRTASLAGATQVRCIASDVALAVADERFDVVVTNPPFHVGKATSLDVPMQFIEQAWSVLAAGGELQLVANRTLPYERAITERFGNLDMLQDGARFKVLRAVRRAE